MYKIDRRGGVQKSFTRTDPRAPIIYLKKIGWQLAAGLLIDKKPQNKSNHEA